MEDSKLNILSSVKTYADSIIKTTIQITNKENLFSILPEQQKIEKEEEKILITLNEILNSDTAEDMYIEDDYIEDVYNELINVKPNTNTEDEIEINEEPMDQDINLKRKLTNDNDIKIEPKKFKTNDALNIQYLGSSVKNNRNSSNNWYKSYAS